METRENIKQDEGGYRAEVYLCSAGKLTWLIGRNIEDRPITEQEWDILSDLIREGIGGQREWAEMLFDIECDRLVGELEHLHRVKMATLPDEVQVIITNMLYNMGVTRFNPDRWPNFFAAVTRGDFHEAADQMKYTNALKRYHTGWYRQTGTRAIRLVSAMRNVANDMGEV